MVVNRVESVPDVLRELKQLERYQREKKERQIVGADVVHVFKIKTSALWDYEEPLPLSGGINQREFIVTFKPDGNTAALSVNAKCEVEGLPSMRPQVSVVGQFVSNPKTQRFKVRVRHFGNDVVRVKFFVIATGRGIISVV